MRDQNKKLIGWLLGGGMICVFLLIPELLIVKSISKGNNDTFMSYLIMFYVVTMFIYIAILVIQTVKYNKYAKHYEKERLEKAREELTSEFKKVFLKYSEPISKERFECQAKVDADGKIICKVKLDYETKMEDYKEFLKYFQFTQD